MSATTRIIVIGASAGGVEAIRTVVAGLPKKLEAAVFITLHIGAHKSDLARLVGGATALSVIQATNGQRITSGCIYVAPPDHHMLIAKDRVKLTKGPRENWARPAIDPLFRSAAAAYGSRVIGVILTGRLNDGTAGLFEVKANGGVAIVQDPSDAIYAAMPQSALDNVEIDYVLPASQIGKLLGKLAAVQVAGEAAAASEQKPVASQERGMDAQFTLNRPTAVTCPDCGGALQRHERGSLSQFTCHIGHVYTAEVVLAAQFLAMERFIEQALRSLNERAELCRQMSEKGPESDGWSAAKREALEQTHPLRELLTREWLHPPAKSTS